MSEQVNNRQTLHHSKKIVKSLFSSNYHDSALNINIFNKNNILSIYEINSFKSCLLIYKLLNDKSIISDKHLLLIFNYSANPTYLTRTCNNYLIKPILAKNKLSSRNFCYYSIRYWDSLPVYLRSDNNFKHFKKPLKLFLICCS